MKSRKNEAYYYNIVNNIIKIEFIEVLNDYLKYWRMPKRGETLGKKPMFFSQACTGEEYSSPRETIINGDRREWIKVIIDAINDYDLDEFNVQINTTTFNYNGLPIQLQFCDECTFLNFGIFDCVVILTRNHDKVINLHMKIRDYFINVL